MPNRFFLTAATLIFSASMIVVADDAASEGTERLVDTDRHAEIDKSARVQPPEPSSSLVDQIRLTEDESLAVPNRTAPLIRQLIDVPSENLIHPVMFQPEILPDPVIRTPSRRPPSNATSSSLRELRGSFGRSITDRERLNPERRSLLFGPSVDVIDGRESKVLPISFSGSLFGKSKSVSGVQSIRRSPVVSDTRVRGKRAGQTLASGSFWVPARLDLDTMLSKIDARVIEDIVVIKGPYSVRYGPGLDFFDVQLKRSSRYEHGPVTFGSTSIDYQSNGQHFYGRENVWGGSNDWGFYVGYGHRTGNDYESGDGTLIPASFKTRDLYAALGYDFDSDRRVEFSVIRLDETDVEFAGQAFDMDFLVTDGFEVQYIEENSDYCDRMVFDAWYNRTRFAGQAQNASKRRQFPILDMMAFTGMTDVDSMSTGMRYAASWDRTESDELTAGLDLRYLKQELNETTSGDFLRIFRWTDTNSPIPDSHWSNPGLFAEWNYASNNEFMIRSGARLDWVSTNIDADESELVNVGKLRSGIQPSFAEIVGADEFDRDFALWAAYVSGEYRLNDHVTLLASAGQAQRAPTLTELYAAEPFMFLLQNGLNSVTGDPELKKERAWQLDLGAQFKNDCMSFSVNAFHAWIFDFITFENMGVLPNSSVQQQVQLKFVNTDLATLSGLEVRSDYELSDCITAFAAIAYVEGLDRSRNGNFMTEPARGPNQGSQRQLGSRGASSGISGADKEPLPGILPLDSQIGLRIHQAALRPHWSIEVSARIVDSQDRVAESLLEQATPGFGVWNLRSYWHVNDALSLMGGVENFGDRNYREHLDYRPITSGSSLPVFQPGASLYLGAELSY